MLDVKIRRQSTDRFVQAFRSLREADALAVLADLNAFSLPSACRTTPSRSVKRGARAIKPPRLEVSEEVAKVSTNALTCGSDTRDVLTDADGIRKLSNRYIAAN